MKKIVAASAALALAFASAPAFAAGQKKGFDAVSTQGSGGKTNTNANPLNQGQTTVTGPHGQVKQGKTANTSTDLPGKAR
jgi:hypothetical protein